MTTLKPGWVTENSNPFLTPAAPELPSLSIAMKWMPSVAGVRQPSRLGTLDEPVPR